MKTLTLFFFIVCTSIFTTNAQITKGNWMVGGDAYFSSTKYLSAATENSESSESKTNDFRLNPNVGYFFLDQLAGGMQVNLAFTNTNPNGSNNNKGRSYGLGPFVRYYFLETDKKINVFAQANYLMRFGVKGQTDNAIDWSGYGLKAGTVLFFNQSVGIEFSLNYTNTTQKSDDFKTKAILVGLGFQIHLEK